MDIFFADNKLKRICSDDSQAVRKLGKVCASKLRARLDDIDAASCLDDLRQPFPGRCHELVGDRKDELSLELAHPYRLVFRPNEDPPVVKGDGGLDWTKVTAILITEIVDYHG